MESFIYNIVKDLCWWICWTSWNKTNCKMSKWEGFDEEDWEEEKLDLDLGLPIMPHLKISSHLLNLVFFKNTHFILIIGTVMVWQQQNPNYFLNSNSFKSLTSVLLFQMCVFFFSRFGLNNLHVIHKVINMTFHLYLVNDKLCTILSSILDVHNIMPD